MHMLITIFMRFQAYSQSSRMYYNMNIQYAVWPTLEILILHLSGKLSLHWYFHFYRFSFSLISTNYGTLHNVFPVVSSDGSALASLANCTKVEMRFTLCGYLSRDTKSHNRLDAYLTGYILPTSGSYKVDGFMSQVHCVCVLINIQRRVALTWLQSFDITKDKKIPSISA